MQRDERGYRCWDTIKEGYVGSQAFIIVPMYPQNDSVGIAATLHYDSDDSPCENPDESSFDWADADLLRGRYILEQWTGVLDEAGKKIFVNDIVSYWNKDHSQRLFGVVNFCCENGIVGYKIRGGVNCPLIPNLDGLQVCGNFHFQDEITKNLIEEVN